MAGPLAVVTGYFDVLRAEHARELAAIRRRSGDSSLLAIVLPCPGEILDIHARSRMVAALRVVDYVLVAAEPECETLLAELRPRAVIHLEADDVRRNREIVDRIRSRHP